MPPSTATIPNIPSPPKIETAIAFLLNKVINNNLVDLSLNKIKIKSIVLSTGTTQYVNYSSISDTHALLPHPKIWFMHPKHEKRKFVPKIKQLCAKSILRKLGNIRITDSGNNVFDLILCKSQEPGLNRGISDVGN